MRKSLRTKNYDNDKIRFSDSFFFGFSFFLVLHFHTKQHRNIYFRMIEIYALMQSDDSLRSLCCAKITQFDASEQRKNNERNAESFRKPKITALNSKNKFIHLRAHDDTLLLRLGDSFIFSARFIRRLLQMQSKRFPFLTSTETSFRIFACRRKRINERFYLFLFLDSEIAWVANDFLIFCSLFASTSTKTINPIQA